ncbi:DUF2461 domain-containing protein [Mesonia maritima]|uniref:Uncharacterized protein (TIGR02453 family) n=1 Tax=Mesonia maritima TaxID=1793873 RepID=A0ABU1K5Y0_9FLAO|nr:DUF2461 domain-containing protein [Mesonia maritima]MDR6301016.1 uncharacterized protein (TIGR02453 family) [Mesonia maritima]
MEQISPEILAFLKKLHKNNNRDWFEEHKPEFKSLEKKMKSFYQEVGMRLQKHDSIEKVKAFRIYRDVRFSKDKTPYKSHFAASFKRKKPALRGGYYLHIQPENKSFLAVGFWKSEKDDLLRVRKEIELDGEEFQEIIQQKNLQKYWGNMEGEQLKKAPKGFDKDHPFIDLLNFKQYTFTKKFSDEEVLAEDFIDRIDAHFKAIRPFFDYMSSILTTDLNGVSTIE